MCLSARTVLPMLQGRQGDLFKLGRHWVTSCQSTQYLFLLIVTCHAVDIGDVSQNRRQGADAQWIMQWNGDVMLRWRLTGQITREPHARAYAASSSSRTKCSRMRIPLNLLD